MTKNKHTIKLSDKFLISLFKGKTLHYHTEELELTIIPPTAGYFLTKEQYYRLKMYSMNVLNGRGGCEASKLFEEIEKESSDDSKKHYY